MAQALNPLTASTLNPTIPLKLHNPEALRLCAIRGRGSCVVCLEPLGKRFKETTAKELLKASRFFISDIATKNRGFIQTPLMKAHTVPHTLVRKKYPTCYIIPAKPNMFNFSGWVTVSADRTYFLHACAKQQLLAEAVYQFLKRLQSARPLTRLHQ